MSQSCRPFRMAVIAHVSRARLSSPVSGERPLLSGYSPLSSAPEPARSPRRLNPRRESYNLTPVGRASSGGPSCSVCVGRCKNFAGLRIDFHQRIHVSLAFALEI